jgi:hypothetical protein
MFQVVLSCDFQLGLKQKAKHIKWSVLGSNLTMDKAQSEEAQREAGRPKEESRRPTMVAAQGSLRRTCSLVNYLP